MPIVSTVRFNFAQRLKNKLFRRSFFHSSAQDSVASQIRDLRKKRGMRQADLAKAARMKQSAVSRLEQAGYSRWGFPTLVRIADALDARIMITFQPAEDAILDYEQQETIRAHMAANFDEGLKRAVLMTNAQQTAGAFENIYSPALRLARNLIAAPRNDQGASPSRADNANYQIVVS